MPARPMLTRWQGYLKTSIRSEEAIVQRGPFDPKLIIFTRKTEQKVLGMEATLQVTSALRDAAMKAVGQNVPEWLSGHQPDGRPSLNTHAAFFSLPFVGAKYADGHIMGLAMAIPREIDAHGETKERRCVAPSAHCFFVITEKKRPSGSGGTAQLSRSGSGNWNARRETIDP